MKERLITLLTALVALGLVIVLFTPQDPNQHEPVSLPTTEDRGSDGLKGLYTWLQREQIPVTSLRKRYTDLLLDTTLAKSGNVLIINMPTPTEIRETEWDALADWLDQGNQLLILGAVYHRPKWATGEDCFCAVKDFLWRYDWSLYNEEENDDEGQKDEGKKPNVDANKNFKESITAIQANVKGQIPLKASLFPVPKQPLLIGVASLETKTTPYLLKKKWRLESAVEDNLVFHLLHLSDQTTPVAWWLNARAGRISLILTPDLFSNALLDHADNARFLSNLIRQSLAPKGRVLFDDYHFGLSELYDPDRFFKDVRLHKTLACLGLFWIFYVIGYTTRLAPPRVPTLKLSTQDFIEVTAGFFARRVNKASLAEALVKHLLTDIYKHRHLLNEEAAWQLLGQHGQVSADQIKLLKQAQSGRRLSLLRLTNTINHIRTVTL